jgi:hypothetical protein
VAADRGRWRAWHVAFYWFLWSWGISKVVVIAKLEPESLVWVLRV